MSSNIYTCIQTLRSMQIKATRSEERDFIAFLLEGGPDWKGLHNIKVLGVEDFRFMQQHVQREIAKTAFWQIRYLMQLMKINAVLKGQLAKLAWISRQDGISPHIRNRQQAMDLIYKRTSSEYHGTLVLPVAQFFDFRINEGECAGYVYEWTRCLLNGVNPFKIDVYKAPAPFKPVPFDAPVGRRYPDLNHLAAVTEDISWLQRVQSNPEQLLRKLNEHNMSEPINNITVEHNKFCRKGVDLANKLITFIDMPGDFVLDISLQGNGSGHAVAFYKDRQNRYHFFDANAGWFRFDNAADFVGWLPFYFRQKKYDAIFPWYNVYAIGRNSEIPMQLRAFNSWGNALNNMFTFVLQQSQLLVYGYFQFFIREPVKLLVGLYRWCFPNANISEQATLDLAATEADLTHSVDDNFIAKKTSKCSSYRTMESLIDVSYEDCKSARARADANPEFIYRNPILAPDPASSATNTQTETYSISR